jgi:hydrogenase maturation factor
VGVEVDLSKVLVTQEAKQVCELFNLSPYSTLSEGTLIATVKPEKTGEIQQALKEKGIESAVIGKIISQNEGKWVQAEGKKKPLEKPTVDPYWAAYWKATQEGWK